MSASPAPIVVIDRRIPPTELARLVALYFEDMVKYVVDLKRGVIAVGGESVSDLTHRLLGEGEPLP